MSHFTVLVIGDNPEAQLEPFWELDLSPEEAAEDPRAEFTDCTDEVVGEWENGGTDMYLLPDGSEIRTWEFKIKHALPYFTKEQLIEVLSKTIDSIKTEILLLEEEKPDNLFRSGFISKRIPLLTDILLRINIALKCGSGELMFKVAKAISEESNIPFQTGSPLKGADSITKEFEKSLKTRLKPYSEEYATIDEYAKKYHGYGKNGDKYGYYHNPKAKWDWYSIGGRWSNMLRLKPIQLLPSPEMFTQFGFSQKEFENLVHLYKTSNGKFQSIVSKYKGKADDIVGAIETYLRPVYPNSGTGRKGVMNVGHSPDAPDRCDQCCIGDLDIGAMESEDMVKAAKEYDEFHNKVLVPSEFAVIEKWDYVRKTMFPGDIDAARAYYNNHPIMELMAKEKMHSFGCVATKYHIGEENPRHKFIEDARCAAFSTFAVLKDGEWYEKGSMGWWGMVSDEKLEYDWNAKFTELIHELPDNTLITVVDCHI